MSLLTTPNVTNSHILTKKNTLSFLENVLDQTRNPFNSKFGRQSKVKESSYQVRQILELLLQPSYFHFWLKLC